MAQAYPRLIALALFIALLSRGDSPWAVRVIDFDPGTGAFPGYDLVDLDDPENPDENAVLGRPTVDTDANENVTVVPVYPAWNWWELVSIGENGFLILEMGVPISNHPDNPYGVDFLVFGNSFFSGKSSYSVLINEPTNYDLANPAGTNRKVGVVSVSDDLETWYTFSSPTVGNLMPTLGRVWDEEEGVWGAPTDPTIPPDPNLSTDDLGGMALTELLRRYRGGAGGTGFDLEGLELPLDPPSSFRYVRIHMPPKPADWPVDQDYRTEIDAVTVVSPASERRRWEIRHFSWMEHPSVEENAVGVKMNPTGDPALLHPDSGELEGWRLEWSPSISFPEWKDTDTTPPEGVTRFFRARKMEEAP